MIKAVFFDLYNTLIRYDPSREEVHAKALKDLHPDIKPEMLCRPLSAADDYIYREMAITPWSQLTDQQKMQKMAEYERIVLREAGIEPSEEAVKRLLETARRFKSRMVLYDDVIPSFTAVRDRGLVLGLISNAEQSAYQLIGELGLKAWLQIIVTSYESGFNKPDPQIFRVALERAGLKAAEAVYIGYQYRIDIVGAKSAGMKAILIDRAGCFNDVKDCVVIRDLGQVTDHLKA